MTTNQLVTINGVQLPALYVEGKMPYKKAYLLLKAMSATDSQIVELKSIETERLLAEIDDGTFDILKGWYAATKDQKVTPAVDWNSTLRREFSEDAQGQATTLENGTQFYYVDEGDVNVKDDRQAYDTDMALSRNSDDSNVNAEEKSKKLGKQYASRDEIPLTVQVDDMTNDRINISYSDEEGIRGIANKVLVLAAAFKDKEALRSLTEITRALVNGANPEDYADHVISIQLPPELAHKRAEIIDTIVNSKGSLTDTLENIIRASDFNSNVRQALSEYTREAMKQLAPTYADQEKLQIIKDHMDSIDLVRAFEKAGRTKEDLLSHFPLLSDYMTEKDGKVQLMDNIPPEAFLHVSALMPTSGKEVRDMLTSIAQGLIKTTPVEFYRQATKKPKKGKRAPLGDVDLAVEAMAEALVASNPSRSNVLSTKTGKQVKSNKSNIVEMFKRANTEGHLDAVSEMVSELETLPEFAPDTKKGIGLVKYKAALERAKISQSAAGREANSKVDYNAVYMVNALVTYATSAYLATSSIQNLGLADIITGLSQAGFTPEEISQHGKLFAMGKASPIVKTGNGNYYLRVNGKTFLCDEKNKPEIDTLLKDIADNGIHSAEMTRNTLLTQKDRRLKDTLISTDTDAPEVDRVLAGVDSEDHPIRKLDVEIATVARKFDMVLMSAKEGTDFNAAKLTEVIDTLEGMKASLVDEFSLAAQAALRPVVAESHNLGVLTTYSETIAESCISDAINYMRSAMKAQQGFINNGGKLKLKQVVGSFLEPLSDVSLLSQKIITLGEGVLINVHTNELALKENRDPMEMSDMNFDTISIPDPNDSAQAVRLRGTLFSTRKKDSTETLENIFVGRENRLSGSVDSFMLVANPKDNSLRVTPSETKFYQDKKAIAHYNAPDQFALMMARIGGRYRKVTITNTVNKAYQYGDNKIEYTKKDNQLKTKKDPTGLSISEPLRFGYSDREERTEFSGENSAVLVGRTPTTIYNARERT